LRRLWPQAPSSLNFL